MRPITAAFALILLTTLPLFADGDPNFAIWTIEALSLNGETLLQGELQNHLGIARLNDFGSHFAINVVRDADGEAEYHETMSDFYVVVSGEATLIVGGSIDEPRSTGEGEIRGPSITGGAMHHLLPGVIVNIPPRMPHQVLVPEGATFTYLILKIKE